MPLHRALIGKQIEELDVQENSPRLQDLSGDLQENSSEWSPQSSSESQTKVLSMQRPLVQMNMLAGQGAENDVKAIIKGKRNLRS